MQISTRSASTHSVSSPAGSETAAPVTPALDPQTAGTSSLPSAAAMKDRRQATASQFQTRFSYHTGSPAARQPAGNHIESLPAEILNEILRGLPNKKSSKVDSLALTSRGMQKKAGPKTQSKLLATELIESANSLGSLSGTASDQLFLTIAEAVKEKKASFQDLPGKAGAPAGTIGIDREDIADVAIALAARLGNTHATRMARFDRIAGLIDGLDAPRAKGSAIAVLVSQLDVMPILPRLSCLDRVIEMLERLTSPEAKRDGIVALVRQISLLPPGVRSERAGRASVLIAGISDPALKAEVETATLDLLASGPAQATHFRPKLGRDNASEII